MSGEFSYSNSDHVPSAAEAKPGETKPDATLLSDKQPETQPNPSDANRPAFIESTPPNIREARAAAEYSPYLKTQIEETGKPLASIADGADADPLDKDAVALHRANVRELSTVVLTDFGGNPADAQLLANETRLFAGFTSEQHAEAQRDALTMFKGARPDTWQGDLKMVREYIARDPRVVKFLSASGVGNSVPLTLRILELARAAAIRGPSKK